MAQEGTAQSAIAVAHPNLALVKYWGYADPTLNLPANNSISITLSGARTTTRVTFDPKLKEDIFLLNDAPGDVSASRRVAAHLDRVRAMARVSLRAHVASHNDFPDAVGMASSAAAFAALSLAAAHALKLDLTLPELSALARKGSGSACRSIFGGYVEWDAGHDDATSYARPLYPPSYWDLRIVTVAFSGPPKQVSSEAGHRAAPSSPYYGARLHNLDGTLEKVRDALRRRDFEALGMTAEREALALHAIAMTSQVAAHPWMSGILYVEPETVRLMHAVQAWRTQGLPVYFTLDAGPAVHLLCEPGHIDALLQELRSVFANSQPQLWVSQPGAGARLSSPLPSS
jgi:diphosphomevalonate decarboxylase